MSMDIKNLADFIGVAIAILILPALFVYKYYERRWAREGRVLGYQSNVLDEGVNVFKAVQEADAIKQSGGTVPVHPGLPFIGGFIILIGFILLFGLKEIHIGGGMFMIGAAFFYGYLFSTQLKTQLGTGIVMGLLVGGLVMSLTDMVPQLAIGRGWGGAAVFTLFLVAAFFSRNKK
jgi:hypothetical protein